MKKLLFILFLLPVIAQAQQPWTVPNDFGGKTWLRDTVRFFGQLYSFANTPASSSSSDSVWVKSGNIFKLRAQSDIAGGGGGTWGSITGTLSSQTDLQTALDGKSDLTLSNLSSVSPVSVLLFKSTASGGVSAPAPVGSSIFNYYNLTGLSTNATFAAPSGTPLSNNLLWITIQDNGTSRTLSWNAIYDEGSDLALPTATIAGEGQELQFRYDNASSKWRLVGRIGGFMVLGETGAVIQMLPALVVENVIQMINEVRKAG